MAIIYKCDKCKKVIKDRDRGNSLSFTDFGYGADIRGQYNIPSTFNLCPSCSLTLAKYLEKFFIPKK